MATDAELAALTAQLTSIETHAKALLSWTAQVRKTLTALTADIAAQRPSGGYHGGY